MPFRIRAFALHLLASACALTLVLGLLFIGWYHWPGWYLTAVGKVLVILCSVDLVLGPTLTLIVANPGKPRRELARDIAIIVAVQLSALTYGTVTLWLGRPLYYTFSVNRLETVPASDVSDAESARAQRENPALAPHWYSRARWVWAPLPEDAAAAAKIVQGAALGGGPDVIDMPRYFRPWEAGLPRLREQLGALDDNKYFSKPEKARLAAELAALGARADARNSMVLWGVPGASRKLLAVFDTKTLRIVALLRPE